MIENYVLSWYHIMQNNQDDNLLMRSEFCTSASRLKKTVGATIMGFGISPRMPLMAILFLLSYVLAGCSGAHVAVGDSYARAEGYEKGGPPPWAPAHGYRAKYKYRYYPDHRVYYEGSRGVYFYYSNGQWRVSANLPIGIDIRFSDYVTLEMDTDKPYTYHSDVEARYPAGKAKGKAKGKEKKPKKW